MIIVPVGGGSGAAGACIAAKAVQPGIGSSASSPTRPGRLPLLARAARRGRMETFAEGLATRAAFDLPQGSCGNSSTTSYWSPTTRSARRSCTMIETTRNLIEAAGAAPLAGALRQGRALGGQAGSAGLQRRQHQPGAARCRTHVRRRRGAGMGPAVPKERRSRWVSILGGVVGGIYVVFGVGEVAAHIDEPAQPACSGRSRCWAAGRSCSTASSRGMEVSTRLVVAGALLGIGRDGLDADGPGSLDGARRPHVPQCTAAARRAP